MAACASSSAPELSLLHRGFCYFVGLDAALLATAESPAQRAKMTTLLFALTLLHANIAVYAFAYWVTQPVLPYLSKSLGADAITFGYLQTVTSVMQILGGAAIGRYVDLYSPRFGMVVTTFGSAIAYLSLGLSFHVWLLFLSRLPTCLMQCMQVAQSYIPKLLHSCGIKTEKEVSVLMGRLSLSYGLGMVPGSFCGGLLADAFGFHSVALLAAGLSFATAAVDARFLADAENGVDDGREAAVLGEDAVETKKSVNKSTRSSAGTADDDANSKNDLFGFRNYAKFLSDFPELRNALAFTVLLSLGFQMQSSSFSVAAMDKFGVSSSEMGMLMSGSAAISVLVNTIGIGRPIEWAGNSEERAIRYATAVVMALFVVYSFAQTKLHIVLLFFPFSVMTAFLYTVMTSLTSKHAPTSEQGSAIALRHATRSVVGIVVPPVAGYVLQEVSFAATGLCSAAFTVLALWWSSRLSGAAEGAFSEKEKKTQ
eukprot:g8725.t1